MVVLPLPKTLEKYKNVVDKLPLVEKLIPDKISEAILKQILSSKNGELILKKNNYKNTEFFKPELESMPNCFLKGYWDNCSLEDKVKITYKYMEYFFKNTPYDKPKLLLVTKDKTTSNSSSVAYYNLNDNSIFIDLDKMQDLAGVHFLGVLFHECTHAKDLTNIKEKIIPELLEKYAGINSVSARHIFKFQKEIMDLNTEGYIDNQKTGKKELISKPLKEKILKAKNCMSVITPSSVETLSEIKTKADFEKYVQTMLYYYSPIERFARVAVRNYFRTQFTDKEACSSTDQIYVNSEVKNETYIDKQLMIFKNLFKTENETIATAKELMDLLLKKQYMERPTAIKYAMKDTFAKEYLKVSETYDKKITEAYNMFKLKRTLGYIENTLSQDILEQS